MEERTRHRAVGAGVLLLAAVIVLPLVLEGSPPGERTPAEPAPVDVPVSSPDRIRVTPLGGGDIGRPSAQPGDKEGPSASSGAARGSDPSDGDPAAGWAVQIGSFADPDNAERLRAQVASRGYRVITQRLTSSQGILRLRVLVGPEPTRAAAAARLSRLRGEEFIDGFLVRYPG